MATATVKARPGKKDAKGVNGVSKSDAMSFVVDNLTPPSDTLTPPRERASTVAARLGAPAQHMDGRVAYRCECGYAMSVVGAGRHRVYFEDEGGGLDDPLMSRACPSCGRELPGRNGAWVGDVANEVALGPADGESGALQQQ